MNFSFGKRLEQVDWRKLASVDIDRISREMDVKTLQENIMHVTYCNIESELGMQAFDPNYVKLFQLAQLIIEYLLHSQEYLSSTFEAQQKKLQEAIEGTEESKKALAERSATCSRLKKEIRKQKEWISEYQLLMRAGASGMHKCHICAKTFVSQEYLVGHLTRRHGEQPVQMNGVLNSAIPVKTIAVTSVEQTQSRLGVSETEKSALLEEMQQIKERLRSTELELVSEKRARESQLTKESDQLRKEQQKIRELEDNYEQWKGLEQVKHKKEMDIFKKSLVQELHALQLQKESVSQALSELERTMRTRPSMIGSIQDEDEIDAPHGPNRAENNKQVMEMVESQLGQMKAQTQQDLHKELQKLQQKWKSKEQKTQQEHRVEMQKFQELLSQHEENLKNEQLEKERLSQGYEKQIKRLSEKLHEHGRALENQKVVSDEQQLALQSQNKQFLAIPPVPQREPLIQESFQRERAKSPDKREMAGDTMVLYVSSNPSKKQFRLWRQATSGSNEWSDQLAFSAYPRSIAGFSYPLYVYTAGGSPYWRQYISQSNHPPSSEYRLDYVFYTSRVARPGTVELHVYDAGSVPVIRSCVSMSNTLPGWKDKGLTFYAMKSSAVRSSLTGVTLSGSWDMGSTLTEDKDEDEEDTEASITESEGIKATQEPPRIGTLEDDDESSGSADEIKELMSGLSSSDWGTGTLEPGEFHPLPHNPLITSRFDHSQDEVNACRQDVYQILEQKLVKQGIAVGVEQLSSQKLEARMAALKTERQARVKKIKNFMETRESCAQVLDQNVKKTYRNSLSPGESLRSPSADSPTGKSHTNRPPKFKAAATAARTTTALVLPSRKTPTRLSSTGSTSGTEVTLSGTYVTDRSFSGTITEQTLSESEDDELSEVSRVQGRDEEEDDSEWDTASEKASHPTKTVPTVAVKIPSQQDDSDDDSDYEQVAEKPLNIQAPRGEKVKELAATLESSLKFGSTAKKPAGGVALLQQAESKQQQPQAARRSVTLQPEDDSDFSLSSDEETGGTSAQRGANAGTSVRSPVNQRASLASQRQPPSSAVRAFTVDDFSDLDDDDDLDVQRIT